MPVIKNKNFYNPGKWRGKPYFFFGDYLWQKFGCRVLKLPINAGLTCPNRDGTIGRTGCIFCSIDGSASPIVVNSTEISQQMENGKKSFRRSDAETKYIAYFQAFTNTYSNKLYLKKLYDEALSVNNIVGLMIATRPDCIPDDILDLISSYSKDGFELTLEIGAQTIHNKSLSFLERGHTHEDSHNSIIRAAKKGISLCLHVILGIPGESWKDMMETATEISALPVNGVKIHHLHVIKGTKLEQYYTNGEIDVIDFKKYVSTICDFIERLRPDIKIHRLIGDRNVDSLVAPDWAVYKGTVLKEIEEEFNRRCTYQGFLYQGNL